MTIYQYNLGSEPVAAAGLMRAFGTRILCRAILEVDSYAGPIQLVTYNAHDAVAFAIVSVGNGVRAACEKMGELVPYAGQHCDVRSVAADRVNSKDPTGRYWLVPVEDVAAVWDAVDIDTPGFMDALVRVKQQRDGFMSVGSANGEAELAPA